MLLPEVMAGRQVTEGDLGCPVCGRTWRVEQGEVRFGEDDTTADGESALSADAVPALLGLGGPGGYVALVGAPAALADALEEAMPGVALVLVNPPHGTGGAGLRSVVHGPTIPLRSRSLRGVVLGPGHARAASWQQEAARVVLPGNRVVGEGPPPEAPGLALAASAGPCWVAVAER